MDQINGHGPVRRWRTGFLRVRCQCGEPYPCPTVRTAQRRWLEAVDEARDWRDEQRRSFFEDSVNNWWENPR